MLSIHRARRLKQRSSSSSSSERAGNRHVTGGRARPTDVLQATKKNRTIGGIVGGVVVGKSALTASAGMPCSWMMERERE